MGLSATLPARHRIKSGAGSDPHGPSVGACHATGQGFPCCAHSPLPCVLPPIPRRNPSAHASLTSRRVAAFPVIRAGRLPRHTLSRPARRLLALRPAWSLSRPWRPVTSECFRRCRYLHHPLRLLPAGTTVAGRDSHPLKNGAFHGAPDKSFYVAFDVMVLLRVLEAMKRFRFGCPRGFAFWGISVCEGILRLGSDKPLYVNFGSAPLLDEMAVAASAPPENLHP